MWSLSNVSGCGSTSLFGSRAGTHQIRDQSRALENRNDSNNSLFGSRAGTHEDKSHTYVQIEISESYQSHYNDRSRISQIRGERQFQRQEHTVCGNIFAKIFIKMKEIGLTEGPYIPSSPCSDQDIREIWLTSYLQTDCVPSNVPMLMFRLSWFHLPSFSLNTLFASDILFQLN